MAEVQKRMWRSFPILFRQGIEINKCICIYIYIYIHTYTYIYIHIYIHIYIYIYNEPRRTQSDCFRLKINKRQLL